MASIINFLLEKT